MIARQSVWSDDTVIKLLEDFVPCADEVWRLYNRPDPDCKLFQGFCDEGGMLNGEGMDKTTTRQGYYCCTPSGKFLGSANNRQPSVIAKLLRDSLKKWEEFKKEDRLLDYDPATKVKDIDRAESRYPKDGMVLKVNSRDMERDGLRNDDWRTHAWNFDFAWFNKDELKSMLPTKFEKKTTWDLPDALVKRVARLHLLDNVRGQTAVFPKDGVKEAAIKCTVEKIKRGVVHFVMEGAVKLEDGSRGLEAKILGEGEYSVKDGTFTKFELVIVGERWGRTQFNAREDDTARSPIGYCLEIAADEPINKIAPAAFWEYGW